MINGSVSFEVNGREVKVDVHRYANLLVFLREGMGLTGSKCGCDIGECGTCTVLIEGKPRRACRQSLGSMEGKKVVTVEGLADERGLHPVQQAFLDYGAFQCGYCTPGMIMEAVALLKEKPDPTEEDIQKRLNGHLCRCTGYSRIVQAVSDAAQRMRGDGASQKGAADRGIDELRGSEKVTGTLRFAGDYYPENLLHGKLLFSEFPHAEIVSVDVFPAQEMEGVVRVLTAKDIPGENSVGRYIPDQPVLAEDKVRFVGDAIALVLAETEEVAAKAVERIKVEYKPLKGVFSPLDGLEPDAPKIHAQGNAVREFAIERGDVTKAWAQCAAIVEKDYTTPFVEHAYMEPEAGVAWPMPGGGIRIRFGTQMPFHTQKMVARVLGLGMEKIHVISDPIGGGFGGKNDVSIEAWLGLGAFKTQRPVRIALRRRESMSISTKRHAFCMHYRTGVDADGKLLAIEAKIVADTGAYASVGPAVLNQAVIFAAGPYICPNVSIKGTSVYTNNAIGGAFRGFGINQVAFAMEGQVNAMAEQLGLDPWEIRIRNAMRVGVECANGETPLYSVGILDTLKTARDAYLQEKTRPDLPPEWKTGWGVACGYKNIGFGKGLHEEGGAVFTLCEGGKVEIWVSAVDVGQGITEVMTELAARSSGLAPGIIQVILGDTYLMPPGTGALGQRQTFIGGNAVVAAARKFRDLLIQTAAEKSGMEASALALQGASIKRKDGTELMNLATLHQLAKDRPLVAKHQYIVPETHSTEKGMGALKRKGSKWYVACSYVTQAALVAVNTETGEVRVLKVIGSYDGGRIINRDRSLAQLEGAIVMGMGYALSEEYRQQEGKPLTKTLSACGIPRFRGTPEMRFVFVEGSEHPEGPFGAKGIGEVANVPTAAVIAHAVQQAVDFWPTRIPMTREEILKGMKRSQGQS